MEETATAEGLLDEVLDNDGIIDAEMPSTEDEIEELLKDNNLEIEIFDASQPNGDEPSSSKNNNQPITLQRIDTDVLIEEEIEEIRDLNMDEGFNTEEREVVENGTNGKRGRRISAIQEIEPNPGTVCVMADPPKKRRKTTVFLIERNICREVVYRIRAACKFNISLRDNVALGACFIKLNRKSSERDGVEKDYLKELVEFQNMIVSLRNELAEEKKKTEFFQKKCEQLDAECRKIKNVISQLSRVPAPQPSVPPVFNSEVPQFNQPAPPQHQNNFPSRPSVSYSMKKDTPAQEPPAPMMIIREQRMMPLPTNFSPAKPEISNGATPNNNQYVQPHLMAQPKRRSTHDIVTQAQRTVNQARAQQPRRSTDAVVPNPIPPEVLNGIPGRTSGHTLEPVDGGRQYLVDTTLKSREIIVCIPRVSPPHLNKATIRPMAHWPNEIVRNGFFNCHMPNGGNSPVTVEMKTTKDDFHDNFQIAGVVRYDQENSGRKRLQLMVQVLSMKPDGIAGVVMGLSQEIDWGTTKMWECNSTGRTKFRIKLHQLQDLPEGDRISIFAVIYDQVTKRYDVSPVVTLQFT